MYTSHSMEIICLCLEHLSEEKKLKEKLPINLVLDLLQIVMTNNYCEFGECDWLQLVGTAMGTPAACVYTILYYRWHEIQKILPKFPGLRYFKRFIDNIFGIWIASTREQWELFKTTLQLFGPSPLIWNVGELGTKVTILDLNLEIVGIHINTTTHHKPMNLYLCIMLFGATHISPTRKSS